MRTKGPLLHRRAEVIATAREVWRSAYHERGMLAGIREGVGEWLNIAMWTVLIRFGREPHVSAPSPRPPRTAKGNPMLIDDLRHAIRRLRSSPGTAVLVMAMLALAIGVSSAMFTVADHMLFRPAPFRDPSRLVGVWIGPELNKSRPSLQPEVFKALRLSAAFNSVHAVIQGGVFVEGSEGLKNRGAYWVSPGTFEMLGVKPLVGRTFLEGEGRPGTEDLVVISENVWRDDFSGDPAIVGKQIAMSGVMVTVIGVMPEAFRYPYESVRMWRPYDVDVPPAGVVGPLSAFARLADGIPEADAARLASDAVKAAPVTPAPLGAILRGITAGFLDDYSKTAIRVLSAGVGLVFLVLCANATNLILARTAMRRQEFGVCSALGASRSRLVRQAFFENVLMGLFGLGLGLAMAAGLVSLARSFLPEAFLLRTLNPVELDLRAVAATSLLGLLAIIGAGLPPAWIGTATNAADSIRLTSRGSSESRASRSWTKGLLIGEVALASALLVGAGVLVTSFMRLSSIESGLDLRGVTTMWITLPEFYFTDRPSRAAFSERAQTQLRSLPGVTAVSLSYGLPPSGGSFSSGKLDADENGTPGREATVYSTSITPGFFHVYGIKLLQGRDFQSDDTPDKAIVSETLASSLWPGVSPLGHRFKMRDAKEWHTVVGVAREVRSPLRDPREDLPEFYYPMGGRTGSSQVFLGIRCDRACPGEPLIRERVRAASPHAPIYKLQPLETAYLLQFARPRAAAGLAFAFAAVSILAAAGGLFSVLTYAVNRRRREFGIRSAMGARPQQLRRLIVGDGLTIALTGLAAGALLTWALSRTLEALAFGVSTASPFVWLIVAGVICVSTLLASWRPAVQAMRADPVTLLRDN